MSKLVRSFIALYPDDSAKAQMADFILCLQSRNRTVRWEQPDKVHITLKFLGDVESSTLDAITSDLRTEIHSHNAVFSTIDRSGAFPSLSRPRIVWLGFSQPIEPVIALQQLVEKVCLAHNLEPEKKIFTPHFTIGRVRQRADTSGLENDIEACSFHTAPVHFSAVRIMESTLTPQGAIHRERARIAFTPGD